MYGTETRCFFVQSEKWQTKRLQQVSERVLLKMFNGVKFVTVQGFLCAKNGLVHTVIGFSSMHYCHLYHFPVILHCLG